MPRRLGMQPLPKPVGKLKKVRKPRARKQATRLTAQAPRPATPPLAPPQTNTIFIVFCVERRWLFWEHLVFVAAINGSSSNADIRVFTRRMAVMHRKPIRVRRVVHGQVSAGVTVYETDKRGVTQWDNF